MSAAGPGNPCDEPLNRVHGAGALFGAYGDVGFSINYPLGVTVAFALGLIRSRFVSWV